MKLALAIIWTVALVSNIICCVTGHDATWTSVFCAESLLVISYWVAYAETKLK